MNPGLFIYNLSHGVVESVRRYRIRRLRVRLNRLENDADHWNGIILTGGWDQLKRPFVVVAGQRRYIPDWLVREISQGDRLEFKGGIYLLKKY